MRHLLILLSSALLLASCGQTGPLYLPDDAPPQPAPAKSADGNPSP